MKSMEGKNGENKNTVKFYEKFHNEKEFVIVMELCDESLNDFLISRKQFDSNEIYKMLTQLNKSFKRMNELKLVHRDLNLNNILVKYENEEKTKYILKLADYGISKRMLNTSKLHTKKGTLSYMAPEVFDGIYKDKCDLWSLGIIIYLLSFNRFPYSGEQPIALINQIQELKLDINTDNDDLNDLIRGLLNPSEKDRLDWNQYYNHRFFTNNKNQIIEEENEENIIILKVNVRNSDKNDNTFNDIYFLDNDVFMSEKTPYNYKENEEIKKLLEEGSIEILINDNPLEDHKKYFKPEKEAIYEIQLNFKKKMTDCSYMFSGCMNIISIDLSSFDSSEVTNMHYMFGKCKYLEEINLKNLNTEKVTDMSYMFHFCGLKKITFPESINTKQVKDISYMFHNCQELTEINFPPSFETNNVVNMVAMFGKCHNLIKLDLRYFDTSNVENMFTLFDHCNSLEEILIDNSKFITDKTKDMGYMFNKCEKLKNFPVSHFNTKNVQFLNYTFSDCEAVTDLDLSNFIINDNADISHMLDGCSNLSKLNISSFVINEENKINNMFDNLGQISEIKVNNDSTIFFKEILKDKESVFSIV
jgi:surface protein